MPVSSRGDYARFLAAQYAARSVVERALAAQHPVGLGAPPSQTDLLASDLADLEMTPVASSDKLSLETPEAALGAAWVLAGSSLGNRAMLAQRRKAGAQGPERFLSDHAMARYFGDLLKAMEGERSDSAIQQATRGALATFAIFENAFSTMQLENAA